jgi:ubiquinone/menaquinone biosynthesis C-methylase UbiE
MTNGVLIPKFIDFFRTLPKDKIFFQLSADGIDEVHDKTRGEGSFDKLLKGLKSLKDLGTKNTISMVVTKENIFQMKDIIDLAKEYNIDSVHYMWLILTGSAKPEIYVEPDIIFGHLKNAFLYGLEKNIEIDNIKNLESQVFSSPGTKYDLGNPGWRSIAIGPDKNIYPTAALIGEKDLVCGNIDEGIKNVWEESRVLKDIRNTSVVNSKTYQDSPFKYITGGGDLDHSYYRGREFEGHDPYLPLYEKIILWIIDNNAKKAKYSPYPLISIKMGDRLLQCHSEGEGVSLTHSNCVLTFSNTKKVVGDFYEQADASDNEDIINPVCYPIEEISHIPDHSRIKSYGCGSPVLDSDIKENEVIVDLGSGAGVECFIASKKTGKNGKVFGIDMLDHMLTKANDTIPAVSENLGFNNVEFKKGFLEKLPLDENTADLITSNCVINLSEDKRETLKEILRVLKPGGRIVISDVVTDFPSPPSIQNDDQLKGECIAGAMVQSHLLSMLESIGFTNISIIKRFFYRKVQDHNFYSLTYMAFKPEIKEEVEVIYPGPYAAVITDDGDILVRGQKYKIKRPFNESALSPDILILDDMGNAQNIDADNSCCCSFEPVEIQSGNDCNCFIPESENEETQNLTDCFKNSSGCMVCKKEIIYLKNHEPKTCHYCSAEFNVDAVCKNDHYVCDNCHGMDARNFVTQLLLNTKETDLINLMNKIRSHPSFNLHGPEHHFTIPGVVAAVYRNLTGKLKDEDILTAIERGSTIPGGTCAFWGGCGAPLGAGTGFGVILDSTPLKPKQRQIVQKIVSTLTAETGKIKAARCCQRESWLTLLKVSEISETILDVKLPADGKVICTQMDENKECIKAACPFYE